MISFDPNFFKAAGGRSSLDKIWRGCFEERIGDVCYRGLNLQMHKLFAVGPHYKNNTECFHNGLVRELKEKTKEIVKTFKDNGPHKRDDKSEFRECTYKIDKSLNRKMCIKFESRNICVAGNLCDKSDFDFLNAEQKELPVIKISCDERREDCQQLKPKGTQASLGTTVIAVTILLILSILCNRVTVNVLVFVLRVVFFM